MREAGNPPAVEEDGRVFFHKQTEFTSSFGDGQRVAVTETGSRPRTPSFSTHARADGKSLLSYVGHSVFNGIFEGPANDDASISRDGTWADDSAIPVEVESKQHALSSLCPR